jgi:hypothetical protein
MVPRSCSGSPFEVGDEFSTPLIFRKDAHPQSWRHREREHGTGTWNPR